jgi:sugar/nucleoside kinase (ribokinase family)
MKYDICCIGHITKDKIITYSPNHIYFSAGGTAYYFSHAIKYFDDINYYLYTGIGEPELDEIKKLSKMGINLSYLPCKSTVYFENIYGIDKNERKQHVLTRAEPFTIEFLNGVNADIIHLGALLIDDFSPEVIKFLSKKGKLSIDSQGFLREVHGINVIPHNWLQKSEILKYTHYLKANEYELETLTNTTDLKKGMLILYDMGVKEVILTIGSSGSIVYDGSSFHLIPAYLTPNVIDATGCGDTYMSGYLYQRIKNKSIEEAGKFGAALATLKIQHTGPFSNQIDDINNCLVNYNTKYPNFI